MSGCPYICMPPGVYTPPYIPHILLCICMFSEVLRGFCILWGVVRGSLMCQDTSHTPPLCGGASPSVAPPTFSIWLSCALVCFGDICMSCGHFSLLLGIWGCFPISWGFWRHISTMLSICSFLYIFVVHYVSYF